MAFVCPHCDGGGLDIVVAIELKPREISGERQLQLLACTGCGHRCGAIYDDTSVGMYDDEGQFHELYAVEEATWSALESAIRSCPEPEEPACSCEMHVQLGQRGEGTSWQPPEGFRRLGPVRIPTW